MFLVDKTPMGVDELRIIKAKLNIDGKGLAKLISRDETMVSRYSLGKRELPSEIAAFLRLIVQCQEGDVVAYRYPDMLETAS